MNSRKVLVVDDDPGFLMLMRTSLKRSQFEVSGAASGAEALAIMQDEGPFAILLTDLMMPEMNGIELMRLARKADPNLEVIIITAGATLESAITALKDGGAFDYLLKPLESISQLTTATQRALDYRHLRLERERLQARVQAEAELLQQVIVNSGDAILAANPSNQITVANPAAQSVLKQESLVGQDAKTILPPPLANMVKNWLALDGKGPVTMEVALEENSIQLVNLTPLFNAQKQSQGWVMLLRDITHLKQMDELKTQMLIEAAARFRLPLMDAMGLLIKLNVLTANSDERVSDIVYRLNNVWTSINTWSEDLIALMRIDADHSAPQSSLDLPRVLDELKRAAEESLLNEKKLKLNLQVPSNLHRVQADADLLRRMLLGLVSRAALRSPVRGEIQIDACERDGQVMVVVSDDGPPVSDSDLLHIFEKAIFQVKTGALISGQSLSLVKAIADRMGGQVWISGKEPRGSSITVCLPSANHLPTA